MLPHSASAVLTHARPLRSWLHRLARLWEHPLAASLLALTCYTCLALSDGAFWSGSCCPYYHWLAQSFLAGRLDVVNPPSIHDLSLYDGRYYLYWGPLPAILLMPVVALAGAWVNDVHVNLALAGLNVALVALVLRRACQRGVIDLSPERRGLLTLFFALGTVHTTLAPYGGVWFTGQLTGFACVALAYLATLSLRGGWAFGLTGLALAGALLSRNHLVLTGLWPALYLLRQTPAIPSPHPPTPSPMQGEGGMQTGSGLPSPRVGEGAGGMGGGDLSSTSPSLGRQFTLGAYGLLPIILAIGTLAAYNWLRFGSPLDNGLAYHNMADNFRLAYDQYGAFHPHYIPTNVYYQYIFYPYPLRPESYEGGSLFLLSPVFLAVLWGLRAGRPRWSAWALGASCLLTAIPIVLLMGTGWIQMGPRYTLDFTVPLLLLTALGIRRWPSPLLIGLTAISILHYIVGAMSLGLLYKL